MLYNIPGRCVVNMEAETTLRLARDCRNIVAVKEASGKMDQIKAIVDGAPEGFVVYSGDDAATYDIMRLGGVGVVSTIGNVAPARMKEIVDLCAAGEWEAAATANESAHAAHERAVRDFEPHPGEGSPQTAGVPGGRRAPAAGGRDAGAVGPPCAATMREVGVLA